MGTNTTPSSNKTPFQKQLALLEPKPIDPNNKKATALTQQATQALTNNQQENVRQHLKEIYAILRGQDMQRFQNEDQISPNTCRISDTIKNFDTLPRRNIAAVLAALSLSFYFTKSRT